MEIEKTGMQDRYEAAMVLSGVGDALGYYNGRWEFCHSGATIHDELNKMGGLSKIKVNSMFHILFLIFSNYLN